MELYIALAIGFLGSFHCIGMCGPIALALPIEGGPVSQGFGLAAYNLGRVVTYACIGLIFGALGQQFVMQGYQNILSISMGILILLFLLPLKLKLPGIINSLNLKVKRSIAQLFNNPQKDTLFLIGVLNGLLPCGLVYVAIAGAVATGSPLNGALFMAFFGLGTIPAMASVSLIKNIVSIGFRNRIRKTVPWFVGVMAVLLILRGMNLGIPYVSPYFDKTTHSCHKCH